MRRKIEKYLSKKQGVDESNIRYTDDGRFDFMGDLEGVLAAVRGKDGLGKGRKGDRKSSKKSSKKDRKGETKMPHMGMPMHYLPYGMPPPPPPPPGHAMIPHPSMYEMMMPHATSKENMMPPHMTPHYLAKPLPDPMVPPTGTPGGENALLAPKPPSDKQAFAFSPWQATSSSQEESTSSPVNNTPGQRPESRNVDFASGCLSSSRKSIFDSPKPVSGSLGMTMGSPVGGLNIHGMTPLSHLKDTFATPFSSEKFSQFSPEDNFNLNKALFTDEEARRIQKTPNTKTPREMRISIGGGENSLTRTMSDLRYNRVSISPVSCKGFNRALEESSMTGISTASVHKSTDPKRIPPSSVTRSIHFADERSDDITSSTSKVQRFMPSITVGEAHTPHAGINDADDLRDISEPSPLDTSLTPLGSHDKSFWGRELGFSPQQLTSYTPFKSPGAQMSIKKEATGGALSTLSVNTIHNSSVKKSKNDVSDVEKKGNSKIKASSCLQSPSPKRQKVADVVAGQ